MGTKRVRKGRLTALTPPFASVLDTRSNRRNLVPLSYIKEHHSLIGQLEPPQVDYPLVRFIRGSRLDSSVRGNGVHHQHASVLFFLTRALADERLKRSAIQP